jgi:hypothetical protein
MTNEEYQRNVEKLSEQIANQRKNLGTDRYYRGDIGALGGIDAATRSMAETLARSGITNLADIGEKQEKAYGIDFSVDPEKAINDFAKWYQSGGWQGQSAQTRVNIDGKDYWYTNLVVGSSGGEDQGVITQPALLPFGHVGEPQKILYNKKTGEQLKQGGDAGYAYAHTGVNLDESGKPVADNYTFGGSFAGDNTSFNLKMVDGVPVFYSTPGVSSSFFDAQDLAKGIGLMSLMLPGIGTALGGAITGALGIGANAFTNAALGNVLLSTVASGGDVDLEKALTSVAMGAAAQGISSGITPEIASAVGNLGLEPDIEKLVTNVASKSATAGTMAALTGRDVETAMQNAALNAGIGSLMSPAGPTQEDIDAIMNLGGTPEQIALTQDIEAFANLGGTPEQQADTALLDYQTQYEEELNKALGVVPQDIHPIDIPQEPPTSYETGIGLPGEEAAAQSLGGFGGTGNILGVEDYEEVAGQALAEAQAQAGGPGVDVSPPEPAAAETKSPSLNLLKPAVSSLLKPGSQARQDIAKQAQNVQQSYNQMLDQYLASQPMSVPFIANIPTRDLEEMFSGQTPIYWQGQA